jgi:predicted enzyme related to lactoylglutathione lyase
MSLNVQTLGWWMRRTTHRKMSEVAPFYTDTIGLPLIRAYSDFLVLLWAGEDLVFEVKTDDHPDRAQSDAASAACIPVFRTHDLAALAARMSDAGYDSVSQSTSDWGQTLFYRGPDSLVIGFELRSVHSPLRTDRNGLAAWRAGPTRLGNLPPLPNGLHYLSRVIRRVADVTAVSRHYRETMGFDSQGMEGASELFSMGDLVALEIAPGGKGAAPPADRSELPDSFILRIHDFDAAMTKLQSRGATFNGDVIVFEQTTRLRYVQDPEGHLTGIEERGLIREYLEDVEADRRWRDRQGSD